MISMKEMTMTTHTASTNNEALIRDLRALDAACQPGSDKHHRAIVLITACIEAGVNRGTDIVDMMVELGFNTQHIGKLLSDQTGDDPSRHHWKRNADGRRCMHA